MPSFWGPRKEASLNPQLEAAEAAASAQKEQRKAVLKWTSDALALEIESIKQVQNGAVFCQLFHILHEDAIDMSSVNFAAQSEFECLANYRILQRGHSEMTKLKLLEWWRLIADEERAWELLAAMRTAVIDSGKLEAYSPLETKHESKGAHLHAPLVPETIEPPSLPSNGVSRMSITRSGSLKNSPHSFVPGGASSFTSTPASQKTSLKAHPNAVALPNPLSPRSPRTPLEAPISPSTGSAPASPAGKEALVEGSKKGSESAPAAGTAAEGDLRKESRGAAAQEGKEQADQSVSASQKSFLRAGSWKFNWPSKKATASPEGAVNGDEKGLKNDILPIKVEPVKVDVRVAKNIAAAPDSPIADCRAAASAPFMALGSLLRRNNAADNTRAGQPVMAPMESQLSGLGMEQTGCAGSLGVPPNLMNAAFVGEPPEEPAYALERVTSWKPAKDATFRKGLAGSQDAHEAADEAEPIAQPKKGALASPGRFSVLATYKLRHVQPMFDHSGALEERALSSAGREVGTNQLHHEEQAPAALPLTPLRSVRSKEPEAGPFTAGNELAQVKLRRVGPNKASEGPETPQTPLGEPPSKEPEVGSAAAQNEHFQVKLGRVGHKEAEGAGAGSSEASPAALPPKSPQSTPRKNAVPFGQASLRNSVAKEAVAASPDAKVDDQAHATGENNELSQVKLQPAKADPAGLAAQQEALPETIGAAGQEDYGTLSKPEAVSLDQQKGAETKQGEANPAVSPPAAEADQNGGSQPKVSPAQTPEEPQQGMFSKLQLRHAEPRETKPSGGDSEGSTFNRVKLRRVEPKRAGSAGAAGEEATRDLIFGQAKLRRVDSKRAEQPHPTSLRGVTQEESKPANVPPEAHPNQGSSNQADSDKPQGASAAPNPSRFSVSKLKSRKAEPAAAPADQDEPKEGIFSQAMLRRVQPRNAARDEAPEVAGTPEEGKTPKHVPQKVMPVEYEDAEPAAAKPEEGVPNKGGAPTSKGSTETTQTRTGGADLNQQGMVADAHPDAPKQSGFSQAMLRRVQSRRDKPEKATEPGLSAEQPASRWGATLKPVVPAEAKPAQEVEQSDSQGKVASVVQNSRTFVRPKHRAQQQQSQAPSSSFLSQVNLKSTQPKPAQGEENKGAQSTAAPFGVKLRRVDSRNPAQGQALPQPDAPAAPPTPPAVALGAVTPAAAKAPEKPDPEKAVAHQATRMEQVPDGQAAEESETQADAPQQNGKFKRMESLQAKRSEPLPTEIPTDLPIEPSAPQASETAQGKDEATAQEPAARSGAAPAGAAPAASVLQPDAGKTSCENTAPAAAAFVTEDEKTEVPCAFKSTKNAKQHDILADTLAIERVASLPGAPKLFRGRKMWARAVSAALASKHDPSTPGGTKKWTDPLIKTPKSSRVAAEPARAASLQRPQTLSRGSSLIKEALLSGEVSPGTPTAKKAEALSISKSFKGRKMWARGLSAIRKETEAAQQSQALGATDEAAAKMVEPAKEGVPAKEAPAVKPKVKTWGTSFGAWGIALKKLGEDPQAAKRGIEEQAAKEEADRISEEARAQSAHLIEAKLHNAEQLLGARGIRDKLEGIRGKYVTQKSEDSSPAAAASPPPPARQLSSGLTAGSLRRLSWSSRSGELSTPVLGRRLSNSSVSSGSGKFEDPRRAMRKKESWGEDWRAEDHISTLAEDGAEDAGPSAGASAFSTPSPEGTEGEQPKPLPAWLLRGVPPKEGGPRKAAQDNEVKTLEQPPAKVTDVGGPRPKFGARLTGKAKAANAAPRVASVPGPAAAPPASPKEKESEAEPDSPKVDISAALAEQDAVTGKKGGIGKDAPAAWQKRPGVSGGGTPSASSSSTMQTAMQRAMQRRASLRRNEGSSGSAYQRIKSMPREHNLAVQSIINASLEPTFEEQGTIPAEPSQKGTGAGAGTPQVSLRDKFGPSGGPLSVRITEPTEELQKSKSGKGAQMHMASLDQASSSVMEGLKKKNKLWIFGKGSGMAQAV